MKLLNRTSFKLMTAGFIIALPLWCVSVFACTRATFNMGPDSGWDALTYYLLGAFVGAILGCLTLAFVVSSVETFRKMLSNLTKPLKHAYLNTSLSFAVAGILLAAIALFNLPSALANLPDGEFSFRAYAGLIAVTVLSAQLIPSGLMMAGVILQKSKKTPYVQPTPENPLYVYQEQYSSFEQLLPPESE